MGHRIFARWIIAQRYLIPWLPGIITLLQGEGDHTAKMANLEKRSPAKTVGMSESCLRNQSLQLCVVLCGEYRLHPCHGLWPRCKFFEALAEKLYQKWIFFDRFVHSRIGSVLVSADIDEIF